MLILKLPPLRCKIGCSATLPACEYASGSDLLLLLVRRSIVEQSAMANNSSLTESGYTGLAFRLRKMTSASLSSSVTVEQRLRDGLLGVERVVVAGGSPLRAWWCRFRLNITLPFGIPGFRLDLSQYQQLNSVTSTKSRTQRFRNPRSKFFAI